MREKFLLMAIILFGSFLRLNNISPFKIYPDSYQNLLVAKNISDYHSVVGYLGPNGMLFPDFFAWTRPAYALLINFFTFFTNDMTLSGQIIAVFLGVMTLPLTYFFIKQIFHKISYALAGTVILAFSFNHTVWSGFLMTETTGIFFMILFLWSFFASLERKTYVANPQDFLIGVLFSFAVMTRYEYCVIALPVIFLTLTNKRAALPRLFTIFLAFFFICVVFTLLLFPVQSSITVIVSELNDMLAIAGFLFIFFLLLVLLNKHIPQRVLNVLKHTRDKLVLVPLWIIAILLILQIFVGSTILLWKEFYSLRNFILYDFVISIFSFIGLTIMLQKTTMKNLGIFVIFSLATLGYIYYKVNPEMDRYMTHLIPFFLIPASYGLAHVLKTKKIFLFVIVIILLLLQGVLTFHGLRLSQDSSWFRIAYEEKAAKILKKYLPNQQDTLIIVALAEPYYYNLQTSTHSITNTYPYIYLDDSLNKQTVFLVLDMPMHEIFPNFSHFVTNNLQTYKVTEFWVQEKYHYIHTIYQEKYPVVLYKMTVGELKNKIKESHL